MKILVIGLDAAAPEILLEDERLTTIRRLMDMGSFGRLESIIPPITIPAWMCMATSQDPGSLGVYGFRNRSEHSYQDMSIVNSKSIQALSIWDYLAMEGKKSILVGVPPSFPPRRVNGICVGCFMTPDTVTAEFTHPPELKAEISGMLGEYPVDVKGFRTDDKAWLIEQIYQMSRKQFQLIEHLMLSKEWDYFQFVDIGLDRVQHGFWQFHDPKHVLHNDDPRYANTIRDYYLYLDQQIERILERLSDDTIVLVVSDHGAQRLDGGFCVNEWLVREGLLVLNQYPDEITSFSDLDVNWEKTKVWGAGGYYARLFFNVKGREPHGAIEPEAYEGFRRALKTKLEAVEDDKGSPMANQVFLPEQVYKQVRNIPPDLIVHFDNLYWRSIGRVGYPEIHIQENDTGPDGCNHAQFGSFILASSNNPLRGEIEGAHLLDIAPTLLELGGYDIPGTMQGRSLVSEKIREVGVGDQLTPEEEEILRERLSGLGYIS